MDDNDDATAIDIDRYEDSPIAWFAELLMAVEGGNYRIAAEAQRQLSRLGWKVTRESQPRPKAKAKAKAGRRPANP